MEVTGRTIRSFTLTLAAVALIFLSPIASEAGKKKGNQDDNGGPKVVLELNGGAREQIMLHISPFAPRAKVRLRVVVEDGTIAPRPDREAAVGDAQSVNVSKNDQTEDLWCPSIEVNWGDDDDKSRMQSQSESDCDPFNPAAHKKGERHYYPDYALTHYYQWGGRFAIRVTLRKSTRVIRVINGSVSVQGEGDPDVDRSWKDPNGLN